MLLFYWWKYAKSRKLELDSSKIKNDRYKNYNPNNRSVSIFNQITANNTKSNRSPSSNSDDDTTAILSWDKRQKEAAVSDSRRVSFGVSQTYSVINILDDEEIDVQKLA